MNKFLIVLMLIASVATAQTKGKGTPAKGKGKGKVAVSDTAKVGQEEEEEVDPWEKFEMGLPIENEIDPLTGKTVFHKDRKIKNDSARAAFRVQLKKERNTFRVYTKYPKKNSKERIQLCINITAKDTNLTYCTKDSICKDPEVTKLLFNKTIGDTVYQLILVDAFTKSAYNGGACNGGKETKLFFVRWNAPKGKAIWKTRTVASCIKTITNMTKTPIKDWDGSSPLVVSYHKGSSFIDVKFDPANPQLGLQSSKDE